MQEKQDQKVVLVSLPNQINLEHEEHTQKKTKKQKPQIYLPKSPMATPSSLSFLTVHSTSDGVTCPTSSKLLYKKAASEDKSLKLYDGMYHSLIQGEPYKNVNLVLKDMREWIDERVKRYGSKNL